VLDETEVGVGFKGAAQHESEALEDSDSLKGTTRDPLKGATGVPLGGDSPGIHGLRLSAAKALLDVVEALAVAAPAPAARTASLSGGISVVLYPFIIENFDGRRLQKSISDDGDASEDTLARSGEDFGSDIAAIVLFFAVELEDAAALPFVPFVVANCDGRKSQKLICSLFELF